MVLGLFVESKPLCRSALQKIHFPMEFQIILKREKLAVNNTIRRVHSMEHIPKKDNYNFYSNFKLMQSVVSLKMIIILKCRALK